MAEVKDKDFIEIEYVGRLKDGSIFDTNIAEEAKKIDMSIEERLTIICVGEAMVVYGLDKALIGKEVGKKYVTELEPKEGFGERQRNLVKTIPLRVFREKNMNPQPGMAFLMDNMLVRIVAVSGGRVITDFNNPLSGKVVVYEYTVKRIVEDVNGKVNCLMSYYFKRKMRFEIIDMNLIVYAEKMFMPLVQLSREKFKEILGLDIEVKEEDEKEKKDLKDIKEEKAEKE